MFATAWVADGATAEPSKTGQIRIDSEAGLTVSLDGVVWGETIYARGGALLDKLPPGEHRIKLTRKGFAALEQRIVASAGKVEVAAVFFFQPALDSQATKSDSSSNSLKFLAEAQKAVALAAGRWDFLVKLDRASPKSYDDIESIRASTERIRETTEAIQAHTNAIVQLAPLEEKTAGVFRADWAAFRSLNDDTRAPADKKNTEWLSLATKWNFPPDAGPSPLVWRNHRVDLPHGHLRLTVGGAWPARLGVPKLLIDGRETPAILDAQGNFKSAEIRDLVAMSHKLRIEHSAIEPAEFVIPVTDGKTINVIWTPKFKATAAPLP